MSYPIASPRSANPTHCGIARRYTMSTNLYQHSENFTLRLAA